MRETTKVQIAVTANDIKHGKRDNWKACPVARALRRVVSSEIVANAFHLSIWLSNKNETARIVSPQHVKDFIYRFDSGAPVKPFSFSLAIPNWALKQKSAKTTEVPQ